MKPFTLRSGASWGARVPPPPLHAYCISLLIKHGVDIEHVNLASTLSVTHSEPPLKTL